MGRGLWLSPRGAPTSPLWRTFSVPLRSMVITHIGRGENSPPPLAGGARGEGFHATSVRDFPPPSPLPQGEGENFLHRRCRRSADVAQPRRRQPSRRDRVESPTGDPRREFRRSFVPTTYHHDRSRPETAPRARATSPRIAAAPRFVWVYAAVGLRPTQCRRAGICAGLQIHVPRCEHSTAAAPDRGIG